MNKINKINKIPEKEAAFAFAFAFARSLDSFFLTDGDDGDDNGEDLLGSFILLLFEDIVGVWDRGVVVDFICFVCFVFCLFVCLFVCLI